MGVSVIEGSAGCADGGTGGFCGNDVGGKEYLTVGRLVGKAVGMEVGLAEEGGNAFLQPAAGVSDVD